ncbi:DUF624 domain-containing protein [Domibacillus sp. A3M-37]|uniref:YesL family protein n=1 Tax=Domibacillus sp. A3M-37 TaxID=2962037 RepID=UPI0020B68E45|nr:DUF624 domain-containing protein [Domibacillus sp. A3M-37]MCP3763769.1 DUF624 domain-containing protein [Domibacillus sp. A3M-37]
MNVWNGKTVGMIRPVTNFLILNVLWIIGCLPIITVGPSTVAALAVLREWQISGNDSVFRSFFRLFQLHFKQGLLIGNGWIMGVVLFTIDLLFVLHLQSDWKIWILSLIGTVFLLWLLVGTALFPCLVHYQKSGLSLIKWSFISAFSDLQSACAILLFWLASALLFWISPVLMLFSFILISYVTIRFSLSSFERLEQRAPARFQHY